MGRSYQVHEVPFYLGSKTPNLTDERLEASFEDPPEEWESVAGWEVTGAGDIVGETRWVKGKFAVEVAYKCMAARSDVYFAARDRISLETWKRDHGFKGQIEAATTVVHYG